MTDAAAHNQKFLNGYLAWLRNEKQYSELTAENYARDLKHLMAQLDRLDEFSLSTKRAITVPLLKQMLAEEGGA